MKKVITLLIVLFIALPFVLSAEETTSPAETFWNTIIAGDDLAICDQLVADGFDPKADAEYFCTNFMDKITEAWYGFDDYVYFYELTDEEIAEEEEAVEYGLIDILDAFAQYEIPLTNKEELAEEAANQWLYNLQASIEEYEY